MRSTGGQGSRANALWGRGGKRANALWGRGGRGAVVGAIAALMCVVPLAAVAAGGQAADTGSGTFVSPELLAKAHQNPGTKIHVIVQSSSGVADAASKVQGLGADLRRRLDLIGAVALDMPAGRLAALAKQPGLTITADAPVRLSGSAFSSTQMWPYAVGASYLWGTLTNPAPQAPTIAIVDSGIQANRADFDNGARVVGNVTMTGLSNNSPGDGRGHGTFVAGVAAGSAVGYAGAAPNARILSIDVMDDTGMARTSDVIAACDYILAHKAAFDIRVANFSLHSSAKNHFYNDPLDRAVEKLWFNGIFVVAAAGNYGSASGPSGVLYAPGNDPFVLTVGAVDLGQSFYRWDDSVAPWSAWGYTEDGFSKPELGAPGRYMIGPVPSTATLVSQRPDHVVAPGYMELSGTSFAAPVVAGTAAQLIARHPNWTPDQIKGALMLAASPVANAAAGSTGVGELNAARAAWSTNAPPNANASLDTFLVSGSAGMSFDAASWNAAVLANASWGDASWGDASWGDASWSAASWGDASWSAASWADASWGDASWADASWGDASWADSADGDAALPPPPAPASSP
jgi:serine protease AprX